MSGVFAADVAGGERSTCRHGVLGRLGFMEKGIAGVAAVEFLKARLIS